MATTDATTQLIQRIISQLSANGASAQQSNISLLSQADSIIGYAANYAQILGTAVGPAANAAAIAAAGGAAAATADAAGQATLLAASASSAGVGAGIVLLLSFILGALEASSGGSAEAQAFTQLGTEIADIENQDLVLYWQGKWAILMSNWNTPQGGLGKDLYDLAAQNTRGNYVANEVGQYHGDASDFVNLFIPGLNPIPEDFWQRPKIQTEVFTVQANVPYSSTTIGSGSSMGWYGSSIPQPQPTGGPGSQVMDPRSMLPPLLLGIQSYLTLQALAPVINPDPTVNPPFSVFLAQYQGDLQQYASFLQSQYTLAVNGIVKSDMPSNLDVMGLINNYKSFFVLMAEFSSSPPLQWALYSPPSPGYAWNGVYGVIDVYPKYGSHQISLPVEVPASAPSCLIDIVNGSADQLRQNISQLQQIVQKYLAQGTIVDWIYPWIQDKLILGLMARWKAIYLFNGYDKVWSTLQNLYALANPTQPPLPALTLADGTRADGNWSARELCNVLNLSGYISNFVPVNSLPPNAPSYSLFSLVQVLDTIATGDWIGPGGVILTTPLHGLSRPAGFRERLAAAAV